jgi:hypothetical protein
MIASEWTDLVGMACSSWSNRRSEEFQEAVAELWGNAEVRLHHQALECVMGINNASTFSRNQNTKSSDYRESSGSGFAPPLELIDE